jgi:hypothetical protein
MLVRNKAETILKLFTCAVFVAIGISGHHENEEHVFIARGFEEHEGVARFFGPKEPVEIHDLMYHPNLKVSLYAAWISCKAKSLTVQKEDIVHRSEFLGFLSGKINFALPNWWRKSIYEIGITDGHTLPSSAIFTEKFEGLAMTDGVLHREGVELVLKEKTVKATVDGQTFELQSRNNGWSAEDNFKGENPACFAISILPDGRKVFATSDKYKSHFTVFCVSDNGEKLWASEIKNYRQRSLGGGKVSANGLLELKVDNNQVAVFWVNEVAISLDLLSLDSGGEPIARFTTLFKVPGQERE